MNTTRRIIPGSKHDQSISVPVAVEVAEWLRPVAWQLFATLEFPWSTKPETASKKFARLIDSMERSLRTRVCSLYAAETRSKSGAIVPLHFHAVFTAARTIPCQLVAGIWNPEVGRTNSMGGDLAQVEPFDPAKSGIAYILKQITDPDCTWDFRNVHLFNRNIHFAPKTNHASRRSARRWETQARMLRDQFDVSLPCAA
jgi:hypothetical protein